MSHSKFDTMPEPKTSAQLKQIARGIMLGKYRVAISVLLVTELIIITLTFLTHINTIPASAMEVFVQFIITLIILLFNSILTVGQSAFYLNIACSQPYQLKDLFTGFKVYPDKAIIIQLIIQLFANLPLIPAMVALTLAIYNMDPAMFFGFSLLMIIGGYISCWVTLCYSQCYYLLLDFPDCSAIELLKMSRRIMKGNMFRLLYIQISFIPMTLLGYISFGIGLLFIVPYQKMTYTLFYLDLIQCRNSYRTEYENNFSQI